jgi:predicted RND superfamily exporter protein
MYLYSRAMDSMTRGMLRGLAVALVLVGVVMLVGLRSFELAAIAALPNIAPLLICAGALGWAGLPLSMATSLVGCIALGLAVDDTAHVMGHLDRDEALESVFRLVGPPVLLTTCALGLGFLCLVLSDFHSVQSLGIATAVTLGIALAADLLVLPSLLVLIGYTRTEKDLRAR